jgi:tetrahydromethanopterin S-methyltransferase subunit F
MQVSLPVLVNFCLNRRSLSVAVIQRQFLQTHGQAVECAFRLERLGFVGSPNAQGERLTSDPTRRVLFLDFDGVLHVGGDKPFKGASKLAKALSSVPCSIVISSSWRTGRSVSELSALLPPALGNRVVASTGEALGGKYQRQREIEAFLVHEPDQPNWRALDDSVNEFQDHSQLIACDPRVGFGSTQAAAISFWVSERAKKVQSGS